MCSQCFVDIAIFVGWKVFRKTSFRRASTMDFVTDLKELVRRLALSRDFRTDGATAQAAYEEEYHATKEEKAPSKNIFVRANRYMWD